MKDSYLASARALLVLVAWIGGLASCASLPAGPTWNAVPGSGRSVVDFEADDARCREQSASQAEGSQQRYDQFYYRCMYAQGHRVPAPVGSAAFAPSSAPAAPVRPAPPPPPPGSPPPPPRSWIRG